MSPLLLRFVDPETGEVKPKTYEVIGYQETIGAGDIFIDKHGDLTTAFLDSRKGNLLVLKETAKAQAQAEVADNKATTEPNQNQADPMANVWSFLGY